MRVAIDARLNAYRRGGIPEYTRQLLAALAAQYRRETFVALQHRDQQRPLVIAPNVQRHTIWTPPHHRLEQLALPAEVALLRPDLLHCPDFVVPLRRTVPAVATIHDLAFIHFPEILDDDARRYYGQVRASVHNADAVIAVSEATRTDIVELLDLPPERIDVVYEAASPFFIPIDVEEGEMRTVGTHALRAGHFALFVSTIEPRKNLPTLLQALRICIDRRPDSLYRLAVVGARGWRYKPIFEMVRDLRLEDSVLFLDNANAEELRWLYNACRLYVNPSLYEGFGLPVLEALACGAPTLVSNTSSLPELVGDAALLLPPTDVEAWADTFEQVWHDADQRADLAARGTVQARQFSWQRAARQTMAIYRRVLGEPVDDDNMGEDEIVPVILDEPPPRSEAALLEAEAPRPVSISPLQPMAAPSERRCLRCQTPLQAGTLNGELAWHSLTDTASEVRPVQAWACPACGSVEFVAEPLRD